MAAHVGNNKPWLLEAVMRRFADEVARGNARHDAAVSAACQIARESAAELYPARTAFAELQSAFEAVTVGERRTDWPGITAWAVGQLTPERIAQVAARHYLPAEDPVIERVDDDDFDVATDADPLGESVTEPNDGRPSHLNIPEEFWAARPLFAHIRQAAHSRCDSADVAFYAVLARLSAQWPHFVGLHSGMKGTATPSILAAICGPSGAGKSSSIGGARALLPTPIGLDCPEMPIGSGEGVIEAYMGVVEEPGVEDEATGKVGKPRKVRQQVRHNVLFNVDEGATLTKLTERNGATLGEVLRTAWSGGLLGQANASVDTHRVIQSGTYSIGMTIGLQVHTSKTLLSEDAIDLGFAQRFLWCWAIDPAVPEEAPAWPGQINNMGHVLRGGRVDYVATIRQRLFAAQRAATRGEIVAEAIDSHKPLMLVKLSALLCVLDLRDEVTEEDWQLAEMLWATSCAVRDYLLGKHQAKAVSEAMRHRESVVQTAAASAVAAGRAQEDEREAATLRCALVLARRVHKDHGQAVSRSDARRGLRSQQRSLFEDALDVALDRGWVKADGESSLYPLGDLPE
jgi:predicted transcriptional regulator